MFTRLPGNLTLQFFISSPYTVDFSPLVKKLFKKGSFVPITSLAMADSAGPAGDMVQVAPEHSPRDSSREKTPVKAPRKTINAARHSVAPRKHSKKRKRSSSKNHRGKNKRTKFSRRYSSSSSASESSESSSSSSDSDSSDEGSSKNTSTQHLGQGNWALI